MNERCGATCDTIVWITGATQGLGSGLARTCPHPDAHVINLSRSPHPDLENVTFDLTRPDTWSSVRESFRRHLGRLHRQQGDIHPQRLLQLRHRVRG